MNGRSWPEDKGYDVSPLPAPLVQEILLLALVDLGKDVERDSCSVLVESRSIL